MESTDSSQPTPELNARIGPANNFWRFSSHTGFDLSRDVPDSTESHHLTLSTTTIPITIAAASSALVVIDMQNYFLSPAFGRSRDSPGHRALHQLTSSALPAARRAGLQVIWLNWGLTQAEIDEMPPSVNRAFGFELSDGTEVRRNGEVAEKGSRGAGGLGADRGALQDPETGEKIRAGRLLMRGEWNSSLFPPLDKWFREGEQLETRPDIWVHKNRMSGMWGVKTQMEEVLEEKGIRTLLFTGVNTDQCVSGTLTDAFSKGYDCVLLRDGSATSSPEFSQQCIEFNAAGTYGFVSSCEALKDAAESISP